MEYRAGGLRGEGRSSDSCRSFVGFLNSHFHVHGHVFLLLVIVSLTACEKEPDIDEPEIFESGTLVFQYPDNWSVSTSLGKGYERVVQIEGYGGTYVTIIRSTSESLPSYDIGSVLSMYNSITYRGNEEIESHDLIWGREGKSMSSYMKGQWTVNRNRNKVRITGSEDTIMYIRDAWFISTYMTRHLLMSYIPEKQYKRDYPGAALIAKSYVVSVD